MLNTDLVFFQPFNYSDAWRLFVPFLYPILTVLVRKHLMKTKSSVIYYVKLYTILMNSYVPYWKFNTLLWIKLLLPMYLSLICRWYADMRQNDRYFILFHSIFLMFCFSSIPVQSIYSTLHQYNQFHSVHSSLLKTFHFDSSAFMATWESPNVDIRLPPPPPAPTSLFPTSRYIL